MTLHPDKMICFALYSTSQAMQQVYRTVLSELDLTYPQYLVMLILWSDETAPTVKDIGAELHLESSTLTPLLKRLQTAGLIDRQRDPEDERQVRIVLTPKGAELKVQAAHVPGCILASTQRSLEDVMRLQGELTELAGTLRQYPET